jgi:hypothetical protein
MPTIHTKQVSSHLSISREERIATETIVSSNIWSSAGWRVNIDIGEAMGVLPFTYYLSLLAQQLTLGEEQGTSGRNGPLVLSSNPELP